jgi:hypothetical protein
MPRLKQQHSVPFSFDELKAKVPQYLPKGMTLTAPQDAVLYSVWANIPYDALKDTYDYDSEYLRSVAGQLWNTLSPAFGQKVTKTNLLVLLQKDALIKNAEEKKDQQRVFGVPARINLFCGRQKEFKQLIETIVSRRCVILSGDWGIGKTSLASKVFTHFEENKHFDSQLWTFSASQDLEADADQVFRILNKSRSVSATKGLADYLRFSKSFVVIDGVDSWLKNNSKSANEFIKNVVEMNHDSCLLLTVTEGFDYGKTLEDQGRLISNLKLKGLSLAESKILFQNKGIKGALDEIIESYRGIPKLLLYACEMINYMGGDVDSFKKNKTLFSAEAAKENLMQLLSENSALISDREKKVLFCLYENNTFNYLDLMKVLENEWLNSIYNPPQILTAIQDLERKSLISIDSSSSPKILIHSEVRGYITENFKSIFKDIKVKK